jgi:hypothetical protein
MPPDPSNPSAASDASTIQDQASNTPATDTPQPPSEQAAPEDRVSTTRKGKVARLPKAARDKLNNALLDGMPFKQAIAALGDEGKGLTEDNVTSWKKHGGYAEWLKERQFLDEWRAKWEFADDLVAQNHGLNIHQSVAQLLANQIHEAITEEGIDALKKSLKADPRNAIQLIQAFAQLTRAEIDCERRRVEQADLLVKASGEDPGPKAMQQKTQKHIEHQLNIR